ncbi:RNA-binding, CRM domain containing protein [Parasponia andersonii]|uniref:RNA-binding, CRM domain containing protein n=1 Tax=Parasponia andersonii TaxID=3476 RepID=A0A2P5B781_PARAD|nr:RNA-binding, CRM domain containing protein [Parasponia andersonii]
MLLASISIKRLAPYLSNAVSRTRESSVLTSCLANDLSLLTNTCFTPSLSYLMSMQKQSRPLLDVPCTFGFPLARRSHGFHRQTVVHRKWIPATGASVELKMENDVVRFSLSNPPIDIKYSSREGKKQNPKRAKMSKRAKVNELKFYRLKAKKKMNSPNPQVRIRYKLDKAKRKEAWLIEKLRKFEVPKTPAQPYDPEILTQEEKHYLKRTGEKKKNYVPVGRRGVFGGVVLNMHLHWKKHETVKVICSPCKPGQLHEYAEDLARLSKGIVIDIKQNNTILFYRGKNYVQPIVMSPPDTLSKDKALEKYRYLQSLEHTSQFIEKLEKELEEYHKHLARYKQSKEDAQQDSLV